MGQLALGVAGAGIGSIYGNPMMGFSVGMTIGGILFPAQSNPTPQDRTVQGSDYGAGIPCIFGKWRVAGQMVWSLPLVDAGTSSGTFGGGGSGGGGASTTLYQLDAMFQFCEGPVTLLKLWADSDLIADFTSTPVYASYVSAAMISFHPGYPDPGTTHTDQLPDSMVVAALGASATPAYTNRATLSVQNFPWSRYGHVPNFTALLQQAVNPTLQSVLTSLFLRVGVPSGSIDFSAVSGITVSGYLIPGRMDLASAVKPLQEAYHFDVVEVDGIIKASLRSAAASFALDSKWIGVATDGEPPEVPIEPTRAPETDLPVSVDVSFISAGRDFQTATQTVRRSTVLSQNQASLSLPVVMSDSAARQCGEAYLYEVWNKRRGYKLTYPPNYLSIAPGDVGTVVVNGSTRTIRIIEQTMGLLGHIEATAVEHEPSIYTQTVPGDGYGAGSVVPGSGSMSGVIQDINAPTDDLVFDATANQNPQVLIGAALGRGGSAWRGGFIAPSTPVYNAANGRRVASGDHLEFPNMSTFGITSAALASASSEVVDTTSSLTVLLTSGALYSCSDADFLAGATNLALIGSEWVYFRDVTQVSTNVYTISHLIRGARGTEGSIGTHVISEPFVWANSNSTYWKLWAPITVDPPLTANWVGYENGTSSSNNISINSVPLPGNNLKCYAPCGISATRDGSNNITLTWTRRSRVAGSNPWAVGLETKNTDGYPYEVYIVDVLVASVVVHSYTVTCQSGGTIFLASPSLAISAADQVAYCGGIQNPITVNVYQVNAFYPPFNGRGYPGPASV